MGLTYLSLESIKFYGVPIEIDEIPLTLRQARVLTSIVDECIDAGHPKVVAIEKAIQSFRESYDKLENEWRAKSIIRLKRHGGIRIPNRYFKAEQRERIMNKVKKALDESDNSPISVLLLEARKRNNKKDKKAITEALVALFGTLNKGDQDEVVSNLHAKLGKKFRFKGAKS